VLGNIFPHTPFLLLLSFFWPPLTCFSKLPKKGSEFRCKKYFFFPEKDALKTVKECENRKKRNPLVPLFFSSSSSSVQLSREKEFMSLDLRVQYSCLLLPDLNLF
jgi:hypothetical protein